MGLKQCTYLLYDMYITACYKELFGKTLFRKYFTVKQLLYFIEVQRDCCAVLCIAHTLKSFILVKISGIFKKKGTIKIKLST